MEKLLRMRCQMSLECADWILCWPVVLVPCGVEQALINSADSAIRVACAPKRNFRLCGAAARLPGVLRNIKFLHAKRLIALGWGALPIRSCAMEYGKTSLNSVFQFTTQCEQGQGQCFSGIRLAGVYVGQRNGRQLDALRQMIQPFNPSRIQRFG